ARRGLPIETGTAPFVYSSHVLEHFTPDDAEQILHDMHRVLRPGGVVRVVVPDLAMQAKEYLNALEAADERPRELEWARLILVDQMVRSQNGGRMRPFLRGAPADLVDHAVRRVGSEAKWIAAATEPADTGVAKWKRSLQ